MVKLIKGSIEYIPVNIKDLLNNLSTLVGITVTHTVKKKDGTAVVTDQPCVINGMVASCLVNTTGAGYPTATKYDLFVKIALAPETIVLYAGEFEVNA